MKPQTSWANGKKVCPGCDALKGESDFTKSVHGPSGFAFYCRECIRWQTIKARYNLTRNEWLAIFALQGESCGACGTKDPKSKKGWHIDHDNTCCPTGKSCGDCIQGITCMPCGVWGDRVRAPEFIAYRERTAALGQPIRTLVASLYQLTA
ncbi:endonuclease domain-containing protein [Streptomyces sp. NPDC048556]|uniref:endonuclease domain-containing protein n=1 Tax=Streptomyces sp. NPDC048556 TaxID=3156664 RepID=UPI00341935D3